MCYKMSVASSQSISASGWKINGTFGHTQERKKRYFWKNDCLQLINGNGKKNSSLFVEDPQH